MENLTPKLDQKQLQGNIDALIKQNAPHDVVQNYINTYTKTPDGFYMLKQQTEQPKEPTLGGEIVRGVITPFARVATNLIQAGQVATGNEPTEPLSNKYLGEVSSVGTNPDKTFGGNVLDTLKTGVDIGLTLPAGGLAAKGAEKGVEAGIKGLEAGAKAVKPTLNATGRLLKSAGEGAYGVTVIPTESTRIAEQAYKAKAPTLVSRIKNIIKGTEPVGKPITEANTAARLGLAGTEQELGIQAKRASETIWNDVIAPKLNSVKEKVNMKDFLSEVEKEISSGTKGIRRTQLLESLNDIKGEFKNVNKVSLNKLQEYKVDWAKFIPDSVYKGKTPGAALKEVQNMMAKKARGIIYKNIGGEGKQAYIDWGNLQSIMEAGIKSGGDPAKRSLGRNMWQFVMDKAVTPVATIAGKVLYRTGEGLEFVGKKGAKKVGDIID